MAVDFDQTEDRTALGTDADEHVSRRAPAVRVGMSLGRYTLSDRLGQGAMGSVFAAHDPLLDRKVAIKVLHTGQQMALGIERMQREARALARLNHPNVVTINDVGRSDDSVYLAMELVEGQTLRAWLDGERRDWTEVLRVMIEVGRGLAAVHEAGLVHRDFKPDNVMLADDGRVLLADFGIALAASQPTDAVSSGSLGSLGLDEDQSAPDARLTRTGALLGTPRYMAPEQFFGLSADPRTDQWAFCVVTWEALFGEHPVPGDTVEQLALSVTSGSMRKIPRRRAVPLPVVRAIRKGMAVEREQRHASMEELLSRLGAPDRRRRRRRMVAGAVVTSVAGAAALGAFSVADDSSCDAQVHVVEAWNEHHAHAVAQAFDATSLPLGTALAGQVVEDLDDYADRWADAYTRACERSDEPADAGRRDESLACLDERLQSMAHLVGLLEEVDDATVPNAALAVKSLAGLETCLEGAEHRVDIIPSPMDPDVRRMIEPVTTLMRKSEALQSLGRFDEALAVARRAHEEASNLDYPPLRAGVTMMLGLAQRDAGEGDHGVRALTQAFEIAVSQGQDFVVARVALLLAGYHTAQRDDARARRWIRHADAAVERLGQPGPLMVQLLSTKALRCHEGGEQAGEFAECRRLQQHAVDRSIEVFGERSLRVAMARAVLGFIEFQQGRHEQAVVQLEAARELMVSELGPDHPGVADLVVKLQDIARAQGDFARAHRLAETVLPVFEGAYGPDHPRVLGALDSLATLLAAEGKFEAALPYFGRAIDGTVRTFGPDHARMSAYLGNRSIALGALGRHEQAIADLRRALRIAELNYAPTSTAIAIVLDNLGHALVEGGRPDEAVPIHERALELWEARAPGLPSLAISLTDHGRALLASQRPDEAVPLLERAIPIFERHQVDPAEGARACFLLAQALDESGGDTARAVELAKRAQTSYLKGSGHAADLKAIEAWLDARGAEGQGDH